MIIRRTGLKFCQGCFLALLLLFNKFELNSSYVYFPIVPWTFFFLQRIMYNWSLDALSTDIFCHFCVGNPGAGLDCCMHNLLQSYPEISTYQPFFSACCPPGQYMMWCCISGCQFACDFHMWFLHIIMPLDQLLFVQNLEHVPGFKHFHTTVTLTTLWPWPYDPRRE